MTPLARTAGAALAATSLVLAFAAAAQGQVARAEAQTTGWMPWLFAFFVAVAIAAIFVLVLWLVRAPAAREPGVPPGASRHRA